MPQHLLSASHCPTTLPYTSDTHDNSMRPFPLYPRPFPPFGFLSWSVYVSFLCQPKVPSLPSPALLSFAAPHGWTCCGLLRPALLPKPNKASCALTCTTCCSWASVCVKCSTRMCEAGERWVTLEGFLGVKNGEHFMMAVPARAECIRDVFETYSKVR